MIKRKDITGRFDNSKRKTNFDDWCSLSVISDVRGGEFAAISFDYKTHFRVGVEISAVTYISENDKSNTDRIGDLLRSKIMNRIYGDILDDINNIRMNIDFEGRQASLDAVDRLLNKLAKEIHGG